MGRYFSDVVEKAVEDLFYCYDNDRAKKAADSLLAVTEEDGDACYFLSCCYLGTSYNWMYHSFEEDEEYAYKLLGKGVLLGSAAAVLGALRMNMLTPEYQELMPFSSIREAWDIIYEKARDGSKFCQYLIGNTYYYLDVIEIEDKRESGFESEEAWDNWRREQMETSILWYSRAFTGGMGLAGRNFYNYYKTGRACLVTSDQDKAMEVMKRGAAMGYPEWMYTLGSELFFNLDKKSEGFFWALKAAEKGYILAWDIVGDGYFYGDVVERDLEHALECYEKSVAHGGDPYAWKRVGEMYFLGLGVPRDYTKAVLYFEEVYRLCGGQNRDTAKLGVCCLLGLGCKQDQERGRALLEQSDDEDDIRFKSYGLGVMYAEGMGVSRDIARGVEYLQAAGDYEPAKEELKKYKKTIFGNWKRI